MQALPTTSRRARTAFGVLVLRDEIAGAEHIDRLRLAAVPTWTASTGFELLWLLEHMAARPSVALVDLRRLDHDRAARVADLASLAAASKLPTILVGAHEHETRQFHEVVLSMHADARTEDIVEATHQHL
jgi:hypothetical protein